LSISASAKPAVCRTERVSRPGGGTSRIVLVPNRKGAEFAVRAGVHKMSIPLSVSETHSQRNVRRTHAEMYDEVGSIRALLDSLDAERRPHFEGGLSTAFGCTLEDAIAERQVLEAAERLMAAGCDEAAYPIPPVIPTRHR
jgi:hydroxymethylglutaryl-CoA lyase